MEETLAAAVIILVIIVGILAILLLRKHSNVETTPQTLLDFADLRSKVQGIAQNQSDVSNVLTNLKTAVTTEMETRRQLETELRETTNRIAVVIAGGRSRGEAGENILSEAFKQFPAQIIDVNFKVNGKQVEYALILADGRRVPIDSKWPAPELLQSLEIETDVKKQVEIVEDIKKAIVFKVREVKKYIDPSITTTWGIAAVPDSAFAVCRDAHLTAFKDNVVLMPYGLTVIYLLTLYQLQLQYCRSASIDMTVLNSYLDKMVVDLEKLDKELQNSVYRGALMVTNAYNECRKLVGDLRTTSSHVKTLPTPGIEEQLESKTEEKAGSD
jgi:DNA recombination protein RmuC